MATGDVATLDLSKGLTPHYYFNFGVYLQVVGERRSTRAEERVLHFDLNVGALKIIAKESLKLTIKLDVINQVIFDESEPRTVLISCHDDRRYLLDFQNAEENLIFRRAYAQVVENTFDISRFNRSLLMKGPVHKKSMSGYKERYMILVPRKLYILSSKASKYPRSVISLLDANPRFDETRATVHLDVLGKEYVFRCEAREECLEWFVALAHGCGLAPMFVDTEDEGGPGPVISRGGGLGGGGAFLDHAQPHTPRGGGGSMSYRPPPSIGEISAAGGGGGGYDPRADGAMSDAGSARTGNSRFTGGPYSSYGGGGGGTNGGGGGTNGGGGLAAAQNMVARLGSLKAYKQLVSNPSFQKRVAAAGSVPLPGMPQPAPPPQQYQQPYGSGGGGGGGQATYYGSTGGHGGLAAWHANGAGTRGMAQGSLGGGGGGGGGGGMEGRSPSVSPGRVQRNGSMPGPLPLRAGMARSGRNGSLPGPANVPPVPGVEVPYRFESTPGTGPPASSAAVTSVTRPTAATAQGILRDKSNTSPWLTEQTAQQPPQYGDYRGGYNGDGYSGGGGAGPGGPYAQPQTPRYYHAPPPARPHGGGTTRDSSPASDRTRHHPQPQPQPQPQPHPHAYREVRASASRPYGSDAGTEDTAVAEAEAGRRRRSARERERERERDRERRHSQRRRESDSGSESDLGSGSEGRRDARRRRRREREREKEREIDSDRRRRSADPYGSVDSRSTETFRRSGGGGGGGDSSNPSSRATTPPRQPRPPAAAAAAAASPRPAGRHPTPSRQSQRSPLPTVYERETDGEAGAGSPPAAAASRHASPGRAHAPPPPPAPPPMQPSSSTPDPFSLLADIQARLRSLSAESQAAAEAAEVAALYGLSNAAAMAAQPIAAQSAAAAIGAVAAATTVSPSTEGRTAPVAWSHVPVPYQTHNTTGETITSAWLRAREGSAWSTGTTDHIGFMRQPLPSMGGPPASSSSTSLGPAPPFPAGPDRGALTSLSAVPGLPGGPLPGQGPWRPPLISAMDARLGPNAWRLRAEVDTSPCLRPSIVAAHTRYLRGRITSVSRFRAGSSSASSPGYGAAPGASPASSDPLWGQRRGMALLTWTFAHYEALQRDPRDMEPLVLLASAGEDPEAGLPPSLRFRRDRIAAALQDWAGVWAGQPSLPWSPRARAPSHQQSLSQQRPGSIGSPLRHSSMSQAQAQAQAEREAEEEEEWDGGNGGGRRDARARSAGGAAAAAAGGRPGSSRPASRRVSYSEDLPYRGSGSDVEQRGRSAWRGEGGAEGEGEACERCGSPLRGGSRSGSRSPPPRPAAPPPPKQHAQSNNGNGQERRGSRYTELLQQHMAATAAGRSGGGGGGGGGASARPGSARQRPPQPAHSHHHSYYSQQQGHGHHGRGMVRSGSTASSDCESISACSATTTASTADTYRNGHGDGARSRAPSHGAASTPRVGSGSTGDGKGWQDGSGGFGALRNGGGGGGHHFDGSHGAAGEVMHSRISLSDFSALSHQAGGGGQRSGAQPPPRPSAAPHGAASVPSAAPSAPHVAVGGHGVSSDGGAANPAVLELQQDISSVVPGMSLVLRVKRPGTSQPGAPHGPGGVSLSLHHSPPTSRGGSPPPLVAAQRPAGRGDDSFAFPRAGGAGGGSWPAAAPPPPPAAAGPAGDDPVSWNQLHTLLQQTLYGNTPPATSPASGGGSGLTAAVSSPRGAASPVARASAGGTLEAPRSPTGEAYRPISNPLFADDLPPPPPLHSASVAPPLAAPLGQRRGSGSEGYSAVAAAAEAAASGEGDIVGLLQALQRAGLALPVDPATAVAALSAASGGTPADGSRATPASAAAAPGAPPPSRGPHAAILAAAAAAARPAGSPQLSPRRRPSISPMPQESSRCIQHAAMVAAEAATSAVAEALSALSRIGLPLVAPPPPPPPAPQQAVMGLLPPAAGGGGWGGHGGGRESYAYGGGRDSSVYGSGRGSDAYDRRESDAEPSGSGGEGSPSASSAAWHRARVSMASTAPPPTPCHDDDGDDDVSGGGGGGGSGGDGGSSAPAFSQQLLRGLAAAAGGGAGGDGGGANLAFRAQSLQSLLAAVNAGGLSGEELLAVMARGGLSSVLRQAQAQAQGQGQAQGQAASGPAKGREPAREWERSQYGEA